MKTLVVIPTYNEIENLKTLVDRIRKTDSSLGILVVDDHSPDGTGQEADRMSRELNDFFVLHRAGKLGVGSAHVLGLEFARDHQWEIAVTMDCDLMHQPEQIPDLIKPIVEGQADLMIGSRYLDTKKSMADWPASRKMITKSAHLLTTTLLGMPYDSTSGYRAFRVSKIPFVELKAVRSAGYSYMFEAMFAFHRAGMRISELLIDAPIRKYGKSKVNKQEVINSLLCMARLGCFRIGGIFGQPLEKASSQKSK